MRFIDRLKEHIPYNKECIDELDKTNHVTLVRLGHCVVDNSILHFKLHPSNQDLLQFIDNNGFLVEYEPQVNQEFPISVSPIYPEDFI